MLRSILFISIFISAIFVGNSYFDDGAQSNHSLVRDAKDPEANYNEFCAGCHGEKMDAFVDRKWKHGTSREDLFKAIKVGYHDEGMPGFDSAFTDEEIYALSDYIITGIQNVKKYEFKEKVTSNIFKTNSMTIRLDTVASDMKSPWGMVFLPNGDMLVTDKKAGLFRIGKNRQKTLIQGVPEFVAQSQGGLLDIVLHPNFKTNNTLYISYSLGKKSEQGVLATTAIARAVLTGNKLTDVNNIFEAEPWSRSRIHYGGRMQFDRKGFLFSQSEKEVTEKENPQSLSRDLGKVHRVKDDGSAPADNPFVNTEGARKTIWSYGHRNPQGAVFHPVTGEFWTNEHGPRGGDEINIVEKGKNYGWPLVSYGINYDGTVLTKKSTMEGMQAPLHYWIPSIGPSGMLFVTGNRYKQWNGHLLVGALRFKYLNLCKMNGKKVVSEEILFRNIGRLRDVRMGPDGYIYMSVEDPGVIYKLVPIK